MKLMTGEKLIHKKILNNYWLLIIQAKNQLQERSH